MTCGLRFIENLDAILSDGSIDQSVCATPSVRRQYAIAEGLDVGCGYQAVGAEPATGTD